jgi:hypothetical protein
MENLMQALRDKKVKVCKRRGVVQLNYAVAARLGAVTNAD